MFLDRIREAFNASGDGQLLTRGALRDAGLIDVVNGEIVPVAVEGEYSFPPAPMNLTASGALANIILSWDTPIYRGHAYTEVWAAQEPAGGGVPDIGEAVLIGMSPGAVFSHNIGAAATRWYWVRFVNIADEAGPYNAVEGVQASTGQDPGYLMDILSEEYGTGSESPYFRLDTPTVINNVTVPAGTYMYDAFIYNGSITNAKIADAAIDTAKIADAAIVTAKIGDAQIATAKIGDAQITNAKILDAAITTAKIGDAQITTAKIGDAQITTAKIADAQITTAKIGDAQITDAKIANLDAGKINAGFISADRIEANSITAGMIDSRGLSIKDAFGNVILAAGTPLATANISGLGSFATLSQITSANVSTYIASAAIRAAQIGDAQITTAKIGDLQVNTLKIANQAVSNTGAASGGPVSGSPNVWVVIAQVTLSTSGGNTVVVHGLGTAVSGGGGSEGTPGTGSVRIRVGSTALHTRGVTSGSVSLLGIGTSSSGSTTIYIEAANGGGDGSWSASGRLVATELKK